MNLRGICMIIDRICIICNMYMYEQLCNLRRWRRGRRVLPSDFSAEDSPTSLRSSRQSDPSSTKFWVELQEHGWDSILKSCHWSDNRKTNNWFFNYLLLRFLWDFLRHVLSSSFFIKFKWKTLVNLITNNMCVLMLEFVPVNLKNT